MLISIVQSNQSKVLVAEHHIVSLTAFVPSGLVSPPKEPLWVIALSDGTQLRVTTDVHDYVVDALGMAKPVRSPEDILAEAKQAVAATDAKPQEAFTPAAPAGTYTRKKRNNTADTPKESDNG